MNDRDREHMRRALDLAARGLFTTTPNPRVGCVIVREGRVIGEGWHERAGEAHAEVRALADVQSRGETARGATIYVTLEPCNHTGRTPPCTDALLAAGKKPPPRRLLSFVALSPDTPIAHGGELILRNGEPVGEVTSAAYGHSVGGIVALGYVATGGARVDDAWLAARFEIDIAGERVPLRASLKPPYDPSGARLKG